MEHTRATEFKVGILALAAIGLFVISILLLGADTTFLKSTYRLKVQFDQVTGIRPGSVVQLLGIPVGNVESIHLLKSEQSHSLEVVMKLDRDFQNEITEGSLAGVRTQGALGDKFIYISPGLPGNAPLPDGALLAVEARGDLFDTLASNSAKVERVFDVIEEAHKLLKGFNGEGRPAAFMHNMVATTAEMRELVRELRGNGKDGGLKTSIVKLDNILSKIDNGTGTLGALVNDRSVFEGLKRFTGGSGKDKYMKSLIRETIQSSEK